MRLGWADFREPLAFQESREGPGKDKNFWAGGMAQLVKCLPCKHRDSSLHSQHPQENSGTAAFPCNSGSVGVETGRPLEHWVIGGNPKPVISQPASRLASQKLEAL